MPCDDGETSYKTIVIGSNHALRSEPKLCLSMQGIAIEQVRETKLLAVTVDETFSWSSHINNIVSK